MQQSLEAGLSVHSHCQTTSAGQSSFELQADRITDMADDLLHFKQIAHRVARNHGCRATFMPQPLFATGRSRISLRFSLGKSEQSEFTGSLLGGFSETAMFAVGGILRHAAALHALTCPSTNSYRLLGPATLSPTRVGYSLQHDQAMIRLPQFHSQLRDKYIEVRSVDATCNPYLALAAIVMAAIDGIQNKIDPESDAARSSDRASVPQSLELAIAAIKEDHQFLLRSDVFSSELIERWTELKAAECEELRHLPHPHESRLYFDR
jgi:glutamine synthetase